MFDEAKGSATVGSFSQETELFLHAELPTPYSHNQSRRSLFCALLCMLLEKNSMIQNTFPLFFYQFFVCFERYPAMNGTFVYVHLIFFFFLVLMRVSALLLILQPLILCKTSCPFCNNLDFISFLTFCLVCLFSLSFISLVIAEKSIFNLQNLHQVEFE